MTSSFKGKDRGFKIQVSRGGGGGKTTETPQTHHKQTQNKNTHQPQKNLKTKQRKVTVFKWICGLGLSLTAERVLGWKYPARFCQGFALLSP